MARRMFTRAIRLWGLRTLIGCFIYLALVFVVAYFIGEWLTQLGYDRIEKKAIVVPIILVAFLIYGAVASAFTHSQWLDEVPKNPHRFADDE